MQWMISTNDNRESGKSVPAARHDNDDDCFPTRVISELNDPRNKTKKPNQTEPLTLFAGAEEYADCTSAEG